MTYVPGFQYDLFVSYASDDDDGRLAQFVKDLRAYLARDLGKLFTEESIFFDRQDLNRSPLEWKAKLKGSASSAAILVPLLSPSYASSDYCAKEWEWFCEEHPLRWPAGTEEVFRVCPLVWHAVDEELRQQIAPEILAAQEERSPTDCGSCAAPARLSSSVRQRATFDVMCGMRWAGWDSA
jgi:hypothetical protein